MIILIISCGGQFYRYQTPIDKVCIEKSIYYHSLDSNKIGAKVDFLPINTEVKSLGILKTSKMDFDLIQFPNDKEKYFTYNYSLSTNSSGKQINDYFIKNNSTEKPETVSNQLCFTASERDTHEQYNLQFLIGYNQQAKFGMGMNLRLDIISLGFYTSNFTNTDNYLDYGIPHDDYTLRDKPVNDWGLNLNLNINLAKGIVVSPELGICFKPIWQLAHSNVTGWDYIQSKKTNIDMFYGGSIYFQPRYESYLFGLGWSTYKGTFIIFGFGNPFI